jgi:hypothetical protein
VALIYRLFDLYDTSPTEAVIHPAITPHRHMRIPREM